MWRIIVEELIMRIQNLIVVLVIKNIWVNYPEELLGQMDRLNSEKHRIGYTQYASEIDNNNNPYPDNNEEYILLV